MKWKKGQREPQFNFEVCIIPMGFSESRVIKVRARSEHWAGVAAANRFCTGEVIWVKKVENVEQVKTS